MSTGKRSWKREEERARREMAVSAAERADGRKTPAMTNASGTKKVKNYDPKELKIPMNKKRIG